MFTDKSILITTAYLPPVSLVSAMVGANRIIVEADENFNKQTIRNRCYILAANGIQCLTVPVKKDSAHKIKIRDLKIDYSSNWQENHIRSIRSAYGSAAFFEYYFDDLSNKINHKFTYLIDLNFELTTWILKAINSKENTDLSVVFRMDYMESIESSCLDLRSISNQKKPHESSTQFPSYTQVFSDRSEFVQNLSILDLLFNQGNQSINYL